MANLPTGFHTEMRKAIAPCARAAAAAAAVFLLAGVPALAKDGGSGVEPNFEIKGAAGKEERGAVAYLELDGAIPVYTGRDGRSALFIQPGAVFSQEFGGGSLYGASVGMAYRFKTAGGIAGLNAFYDLNWRRDSGRARQHAQGSVGADFQTGRSLIGANWYFPLSGKVAWESGQYRITEEAVGGAELRYRFALDDRWALKGRAFFEIGSGGKGAGSSNAAEDSRLLLAAGASYRIGCTRIGFDIEHDTGTRQTALLASVAVQFGAGDAPRSCAVEEGGSLIALVERSKIIQTRQTVTAARIVPFTMLPDDVRKLFAEVDGGDPEAEEVWLFSQGGPLPFITDEDGNHPAIDFDAFPGHDTRRLINVHQAQTFNPGLFTDKRLTSLERIQAEMDVSVEILHRVIRHFKSRARRSWCSATPSARSPSRATWPSRGRRRPTATSSWRAGSIWSRRWSTTG